MEPKPFPRHQESDMSFTAAVVLVAVLDVLVIAALATVAVVPFRIDRRRAAAPASVHRLGSADLLEPENVAAA